MFGRPPEGGLLSFRDGVGWTAAKCSGVFRRWAEHERRLLALRRLRWARLLRLSAALFWSAEPYCKPRLKPMPRASSQAYARPLLDPTLKCSLTYIAPAYRSLPRMLPILRACDTLRSKMRGSCQKSGGFHQAGEEIVSLNSGWLCLRFSDLAICSGGIETGSVNRFHDFWIRRQNNSI